MTSKGFIELDRSTKGAGRKRYHYFRAVFWCATFRYRRRFRTKGEAAAFLADDSARAAWVDTHSPRRNADEQRQYLKDRRRRAYQRKRIRMATDAAFYAKHRARQRIYGLMHQMRRGKTTAYRPRFDRRVPDWATCGGVLWAASPYLATNLTPAQRAYARELAIERKSH